MKRIKLKMLGVTITLVMVMGVILSGLNVSEAGVVTSKAKSFNAFLTQVLNAEFSADADWNDELGDEGKIGKIITENYIDSSVIEEKGYKCIYFDDISGLSYLSIQTSFLMVQPWLEGVGETADGTLVSTILEAVEDDDATITFQFTLARSSVGGYTGTAGETFTATYTKSSGWVKSGMPSTEVLYNDGAVSSYPYKAEFLGLTDFGYPISVNRGNSGYAEYLSEFIEYWEGVSDEMLYVTTSSGQVYYLVGIYDPSYVYAAGTYSEDNADIEYSVQYALLSEEAFDDYEFSTELSYDANYLDGTNAGGTLTDGTYYPNQKKADDISITYPTVDDGSYYAELQEKYESLEPTVTATIESKTGEGIVSTNEVAMNTDGTANSEGWYYPDTTDTTVIAKDYLFTTYNNDEDNGIVNETVALVGETGGEDNQTVSITWPFRIIDEIYKENDDGSTTVTIVTNLPMDPDQIEDGWKYVDGSDYHEIRKTYAAGEDVDENVTVYQNETGGTDETTVQIDAEADEAVAEEEKDEADEDLPKTGGTIAVGVFLIIVIALSVVLYRKKKNIYNK